jgi:hypothetical protein
MNLGSMLGSTIGSMFGPMGTMLGSMIGGAVDQLLNQLISQFGQQNVQNAMTNTQANGFFEGIKEAISQSGLGDFAKNMLMNAVNQAQSDYTPQPTSASCQDAVDDAFGEQAKAQGREFGENLLDSIMSSENDGKGKKSWLVVLAEGMARVATEHLHKMIDAQEQMEKSGENNDKKEASSEFTEGQAKFQAESKLFSMAIEATSTALKAVGDGLASLARKQ